MSVFYKRNSLNNDSLLKEAKGLELLKKNLIKHDNKIKIPKIYSVNKEELKLEKIDTSLASSSQMQILGENLAKLHKIKFESYGFEEDNYIGLNKQKNTLHENWAEFFIEYRLLYQINLIKNSKIKNDFLFILEKNRKNLSSFLNETCTHPSLVHGDLWSGNVLFDKKDIYLIDPAIYYADREVDIAMSELFGGFSKEFYSSYNNEYKLSKEYEDKKIIYNLYHYLNHYNLFGNSYLRSCIRAFDFLDCI